MSEDVPRSRVQDVALRSLGKALTAAIQRIGFFSDVALQWKEVVEKGSLTTVFQLNEGTYCTALYLRRDGSEVLPYDTMKILYVASDLGGGTGVFLLSLHLLMAYLTGLREVELENMTDDPARAARGIYRLFTVNWRGKAEELASLRSTRAAEAAASSEEQNNSLSASLHATEGAMRLTLRSDFFAEWEQFLRSLAPRATGPPWADEYAAHIRSLIRWIQQYRSVSATRQRHYNAIQKRGSLKGKSLKGGKRSTRKKVRNTRKKTRLQSRSTMRL